MEPAPLAAAGAGRVETTPPDAPAVSRAALSANGGGMVAVGGAVAGGGASARAEGSPSTDATETGAGAGVGATMAPT